MVVLLDVPTDRVCLDSDAMEDFVKTTAAVDAFKFAMDVFCCAAFCFVAQTQNKVKKNNALQKWTCPTLREQFQITHVLGDHLCITTHHKHFCKLLGLLHT